MIFDVFGRRLQIEGSAGEWRCYWPGGDGKRRPAGDVLIPPDVTEDQLEAYLADLCHEWATAQHSRVTRLSERDRDQGTSTRQTR